MGEGSEGREPKDVTLRKEDSYEMSNREYNCNVYFSEHTFCSPSFI